MRRRTVCMAVVALVGCNQEPPKDDLETASVAGTIELVDRDGTADFQVFRAFAYESEGTMLAFLSSNVSTTCQDAANYLSGSRPLEKDNLMRSGTCAMTILLKGRYAYSGELSAVGPESDTEVGAAKHSVIECAMGGGEFRLESDGEVEDYYWTGRWWEGTPETYVWNISGEGGDISFDLEMSSYTGALPYEGLGDVFAFGDVAGTVSARWCPELAWSEVYD